MAEKPRKRLKSGQSIGNEMMNTPAMKFTLLREALLAADPRKAFEEIPPAMAEDGGAPGIFYQSMRQIYDAGEVPNLVNTGRFFIDRDLSKMTVKLAEIAAGQPLTAVDQRGQDSQKFHGEDSKLTASGQTRFFGQLSTDVREFVERANGPFTNNDLKSELCLKSRKENKALYQSLSRLEKEGKISKIEGKNGCWKPVLDAPEPMDLLAKPTDPVNVPFPLNISGAAKIREGNITLIAGAPNCGKTSFLLYIVHEFLTSTYLINKIDTLPEKMNYFNSEMGLSELQNKLLDSGTPLEKWAKNVDFIPRARDFADLIQPDGINFIDFLEVNEDFFLAGKFISEIHSKLKTGLAFIAMQKKPGADFAKGGFMTLEKPRLVMNLDRTEKGSFTCKLMKVKEPVDYTCKLEGMEREFVFEPGMRIKALSDWRYPAPKKVNRWEK